jgi:hypothetical protein
MDGLVDDGRRERQAKSYRRYLYKGRAREKRQTDKFSSLRLYSVGGSKYLKEKYEF